MAPKDAFGFHEKNKPEGGKNETHRDRRGSCGGIPDKSLLCATRPDPTRGGGTGGGESCSGMQNTFCRRRDRDSMTDGRACHPYRVTAGTGNKQQTLMRALKVVRVMFGITDVGLQSGCLSRGQLQGPCSGAERGGMYSLDWWSRLLNRTRWAG